MYPSERTTSHGRDGTPMTSFVCLLEVITKSTIVVIFTHVPISVCVLCPTLPAQHSTTTNENILIDRMIHPKHPKHPKHPDPSRGPFTDPITVVYTRTHYHTKASRTTRLNDLIPTLTPQLFTARHTPPSFLPPPVRGSHHHITVQVRASSIR